MGRHPCLYCMRYDIDQHRVHNINQASSWYVCSVSHRRLAFRPEQSRSTSISHISLPCHPTDADPTLSHVEVAVEVEFRIIYDVSHHSFPEVSSVRISSFIDHIFTAADTRCAPSSYP